MLISFVVNYSIFKGTIVVVIVW